MLTNTCSHFISHDFIIHVYSSNSNYISHGNTIINIIVVGQTALVTNKTGKGVQNYCEKFYQLASEVYFVKRV